MPMSDKEFCKYFGHLENHQFRGYNRALGCNVESKEHFKMLLDKGGFIPTEKAHIMAEETRAKKQKKYDGLSEKSMKFLNQVKWLADSKGNIPLTDGFVKGCEEVGMKFDYYNKLPSCYRTDKGGLV